MFSCLSNVIRVRLVHRNLLEAANKALISRFCVLSKSYVVRGLNLLFHNLLIITCKPIQTSINDKLLTAQTSIRYKKNVN